MERYPDIEIYLAEADITALDEWLGSRLDAPPLQRRGKRQWRSDGHCQARTIPVMLVENAADGYASLWFDSDATPWPRDIDCARDAARALGCEVRCSLGGWQPGDDPDRFWQVRADGQEGAITWPDSGQ
ncbi:MULTISPECIES: hypothetical protein [unclassified Modicisalibacter]|uniref:hypothetical protein n=1 Tax=unclassified Modicisalibacter TaxID=2679913 RepID=UPI001CCD7CE6|nr:MULTISPECIES: hypothetical protein [unclassified Modicisalibacter]MBZ9558141.1 hypothetical protein [Modicisalibacter sp. R2A 31.J]MBZ9573190.1 hypothetical protein [Modicisalibacter sp. MOD 31.J]